MTRDKSNVSNKNLLQNKGSSRNLVAKSASPVKPEVDKKLIKTIVEQQVKANTRENVKEIEKLKKEMK